MPIREVSPGIYQLGEVRIDKAQRTISFRARLNLDQGPMEYFLVTSWGKTHESILKTDTEPFRIHLAMLLIDTTAGAAANATNGSRQPREALFPIPPRNGCRAKGFP